MNLLDLCALTCYGYLPDHPLDTGITGKVAATWGTDHLRAARAAYGWHM